MRVVGVPRRRSRSRIPFAATPTLIGSSELSGVCRKCGLQVGQHAFDTQAKALALSGTELDGVPITVSDVTGGLGVLIDGNPANMSLSHGHVVRGNSVRGHRSPPTEFSNFDGAIPLACHYVPISTERAQRYMRS